MTRPLTHKPDLTPAEAAAFIMTALDVALKPAAEALPLAIPGTPAHRNLSERVAFLRRAQIIARESGVLITAEGEPVAGLLDEIVAAMPPPSTQKLSVPWRRAHRQALRPHFRFNPETATLTDTQTGLFRTWEGEGADNARGVFELTDSGAHKTPAGVGVCGAHEKLAAELLERP